MGADSKHVTDGTFIWRSPLGRTYVVKPEPVDDPDEESDS